MKEDNCLRDFALAQQSNTPAKNPFNAAHTSFTFAPADSVEVQLIYMYLGGVDNGYILYSDVDLFFHGQIPVNKTKWMIDKALVQHLAQVLAAGSTGH